MYFSAYKHTEEIKVVASTRSICALDGFKFKTQLKILAKVHETHIKEILVVIEVLFIVGNLVNAETVSQMQQKHINNNNKGSRSNVNKHELVNCESSIKSC